MLSNEEKPKNNKPNPVTEAEKELRIDISMLRILAKKRPNEFKAIAQELLGEIKLKPI